MKNNILDSISLAFKKTEKVEDKYSFSVCFKDSSQASFLQDLLSKSNLNIDLILVDNFLYKVFSSQDDAKSFKHDFTMFLKYIESSLLKNEFESNWIDNLKNDISSLGVTRHYVISFSNEIDLIKTIKIKEESYKTDLDLIEYNNKKEIAKNELLNYSIQQFKNDMVEFVFSNWIGFKNKEHVKTFVTEINELFDEQSSGMGFLTKGVHSKTLRLIIKKFSITRFNKPTHEFTENDLIEFENIENIDFDDSFMDFAFNYDFLDDYHRICNQYIAKNYKQIKINTDTTFSKFSGVNLSYDPLCDLDSRLSIDEILRNELEQCKSQHKQLIFIIVSYRIKMTQILQDNHYNNSLIEISKKLNTCSAQDINELAEKTSLIKL